jgi:hypothetical protein
MILYPETKRMKLEGFEALNLSKKIKRDKDRSLDECLICHRRYKDLHHHINITHLMKKREYEQYIRENH